MRVARLYEKIGPKRTALILVALGFGLILIYFYFVNRPYLVALRLHNAVRSWLEHSADTNPPTLSARLEGSLVIRDVTYPLEGRLYLQAPDRVNLRVRIEGTAGEYRLVNGGQVWIIAEQAKTVVVGRSLSLSTSALRRREEFQIQKAAFGDFGPLVGKWFPTLAQYKFALAKSSGEKVGNLTYLDVRSSRGSRLFGVCDYVVIGILPGRWIPVSIRAQGRYGDVPFAGEIVLRDISFEGPMDPSRFHYEPDPNEMTIIRMPRGELLNYLVRHFRELK